MFRGLRLNLETINVLSSQIRFRSSVKDSIPSSKWDLFAAICLTRCPVIVPELNWLEKRMQNIMNRVEIANSLYSDHEMRHFEDLRRSERIATGTNVQEKDLEEAAKQTAQDFEEASLEEAKQFKCASSVTKSDLSNNEKSIDRSLDKHLYLAIKTKLGQKEYWLFPQEQYQPDIDESLRNTAERALQSCFPHQDGRPTVYVKFLGNSPSSYYSYRYPKQLMEQTQKCGRRLFLFKCQLDVNQDKHPAAKGTFGERILKPHNYLDFAWLTNDELGQRIPKQYWQKLGQSIYPDQLINAEQLISSGRHKKISRITKRLEKVEQSN